MIQNLALSLCFLLSCLGLQAQGPETALKVGDAAPDFHLTDPTGKSFRLHEALKNGPVVLVWYRGNWCPYCNRQLQEYEENIGAFRKHKAQLWAISGQLPDKSAEQAEKRKQAFAVLSDTALKVARAYGIAFEVPKATANKLSTFISWDKTYGPQATRELPHPATYIVAPDGRIAYAFVETDYTQRATATQLLEALAKLNP